ncbi:hypothetical protein GUITHDRAFT_146648 [Guillardia theta CCMP2712]|uniref:Uncharacterized protein n=1 Tax=Guillardia theta (strain CCMP2712) TaxID=905079 RepID=L1IH44_GUITC|nr:hypothetical protein GUITHDRAFT_146648 [Guillardia theta CCMP2712]EKX35239.1 hypothetical protein GUITHDRAFT_146648 [Guillardia theta CCMP2712]|eukprot:XP_005822219.1 hypothetical protein GUITHDRAFT_146648 [Guillardia theta CCMP2712]
MCKVSLPAVFHLSVVNGVLGLALLVAGIVAATYKIPDTCSQPSGTSTYGYDFANCVATRDSVNSFLRSIALWGTLPAAVPIVFCLLGVFAAKKRNKTATGVLLAFLIVGIITSLIGVAIPLTGAAVASSFCGEATLSCAAAAVARVLCTDDSSRYQIWQKQDSDFCGRYVGSLWAIVALNVVLVIFQTTFSIIVCVICCNPGEWDEGIPTTHRGPSIAIQGQLQTAERVQESQQDMSDLATDLPVAYPAEKA